MGWCEPCRDVQFNGRLQTCVPAAPRSTLQQWGKEDIHRSFVMFDTAVLTLGQSECRQEQAFKNARYLLVGLCTNTQKMHGILICKQL